MCRRSAVLRRSMVGGGWQEHQNQIYCLRRLAIKVARAVGYSAVGKSAPSLNPRREKVCAVESRAQALLSRP
jgi:hypothetical protein